MFLTTDVLDPLTSRLGQDSIAFLPELILCGTIVLLLVLRLFSIFDRLHLGWLALLLTLGALTVSAGLAVFPWDATDSESLIREADKRLMMGAKKQGKNTIHIVGADEPAKSQV